jgi:signal transduction histidine kinase
MPSRLRLGTDRLDPPLGRYRRSTCGLYYQGVTTLAARITAVRRGLADRIASLPERRQEQLTDTGLAVALAAVNVVSVLPYRAQLHPLWLALFLLAGQALPLAWRRSAAVGTGLLVGAARISYDKIGFGFAPLPLGPAIAVYTVFDRRGPAFRLSTAALVVVGVTISLDSPGHSEPYEAIFQGLIFATAMAAGALSRAKRASLQAAQSRAERAESELDQEAARAAAAERARIARELHDVVAHHVSLMAVQAEAAASLLPSQPDRARQSVDIIGDTARQALTELRRLLGVLRGPTEHRPATSPTASLTDLGDILAKVREAGLPVEYEVSGTPAVLAPGIELTAFRIVQEALTNTLRHADAAQARVTVKYEPGYVTLSVADSGPRRTEPPARSGTGFGLAGIAERVASCGGSLTVGPSPASGFALTARLPVR